MSGVQACGDCGAPLTPGPLPSPPAADSNRHRAEPSAAQTPDTKLIDLPGLQADFAVQALTLEGIVCGLECQGIRKIRLPAGPPEEPLAVTLAVSIYVPSDRMSEAQSILRSLEPEDVIGAQWQPTPEVAASGEPSPFPRALDPPPTDHRLTAPRSTTTPPRGEGTTLRLLLFLAIAAVVTYALAR